MTLGDDFRPQCHPDAQPAAPALPRRGLRAAQPEDQLPHLEVTRDVARRINRLYFEEPYFPEPECSSATYRCCSASTPSIPCIGPRSRTSSKIAALSASTDPYVVADEIGDAGAGALKRRVTASLNAHLAPIRHRRLEFAADPAEVWRVVREGCARAESIANQTLIDLRNSMGMAYF